MRSSATVQTDLGPLPAPYTMGTGSLLGPPLKSHPHLAPKLKKKYLLQQIIEEKIKREI
jgi:hypothetical protein